MKVRVCKVYLDKGGMKGTNPLSQSSLFFTEITTIDKTMVQLSYPLNTPTKSFPLNTPSTIIEIYYISQEIVPDIILDKSDNIDNLMDVCPGILSVRSL